jgi:hypothetical protein
MGRVRRLQAAQTIATLLAGAWRSEPPVLSAARADIESVLPFVANMKIAPLVWWRLRHAGMTDVRGAAGLRDAYRYAALEAEQHHHHIATVLGLLRGASIEPILFKGWDIARCYPQPGLRRYEDIDVVVRPQEFELAQRTLDRHDLGDAIVDLEHAEISQFDRADWDGLFARSALVEAGALSVRVLSQEDRLRAICIHGLKHSFSSAIWLCDIAAALESVGAGFDCDRLFGRVEPQAQWVACAIAAARQILNCDVPQTIAERIGTAPAWLAPVILKGWIAELRRVPYGRAAIHEFRDRPGHLPAIVASRWPNLIQVSMGRNLPLSQAHAWRRWSQKLTYFIVPKRLTRALCKK